MQPHSPSPDCPWLADCTAALEYRDLINALDDVVFRFDIGGRWSYLSPAWEKRLGWGVAECLGRAAVKFVHPEDRPNVLANWAEVVAGRQHSYRREVRFRTVSGEHLWMLVSARGLRDAGGALRGVIGTLTDVSAAKEIETELISARAAAEGANKTKSEFLATMSHELRTPLNAVIGLSESLLEAGSDIDPERARRYLGIIQSSGRQLLAQINDILDLARIEAGRIRLNTEVFDLGRLCTAAIDAVRREAAARQLELQLLLPATPNLVHGDERLLWQVLQNLVSNAVKFTSQGGRITLALERLAGGALRVKVTDTGIGIAEEKLPLLFRPFSQVDSSLARQYGGTGLGLALVERIVRLHGGRVGVTSKPGVGSTFAFELPAPPAPAGTAAGVPAAPERSSRERGRTVMLVHGEAHERTRVGDFLRQRGLEVLHCESPAAAFEQLRIVQPGLAIVDVRGSRGAALISHLRRSVPGDTLTIISLGPEEAAESSRSAGADAHVAAPVVLTELAQHLAAFADPAA